MKTIKKYQYTEAEKLELESAKKISEKELSKAKHRIRHICIKEGRYNEVEVKGKESIRITSDGSI